jgi:adenylate cyclase
MKLRNFLILFVLSFAAVTMLNDYITIGLQKLSEDIKKNRYIKQETLEIAEYLLIANQYKTRFSRSYIATGNQTRIDLYNDILAILNGEIALPKNYSDDYWDRVAGGYITPPSRSKESAKPIEELFLDLNISNAEFNKLKEAKIKLFDLSNTEKQAMELANDYYKNGKQSSSEKLATATDLVFNDNYVKMNAEVAQLISEFKSMINVRFSRHEDIIQEKYNELVFLNEAVSAVLYLMILLSIAYLYFHIQRRAENVIQTLNNIGDGDLSARSTTSGNDEIGYLASLVNITGAKLQEKVYELNDKVIKTENLMDELKKERDRSEKLLHNILPAAIAERLTAGEDNIAEVFPEVTVLFSDIVGFTELSEKIGPSGTVNMLNLLFGKFDELAEKHGVEKIKTIGDCYMVVGGVPNRDPLHCQHIAAFAMEALACIERLPQESPYQVQLRIGIHTGTVAAGVVGKKRFSYDLWGDVVNVASRFESTAEPNKIHVSEAVKFRLSDDFMFLDGGEIKLKGKGVMRSFYLLGSKENMPEILEFRKV